MIGGIILSYNGLNAWAHYVPDVTSYGLDPRQGFTGLETRGTIDGFLLISNRMCPKS